MIGIDSWPPLPANEGLTLSRGPERAEITVRPSESNVLFNLLQSIWWGSRLCLDGKRWTAESRFGMDRDKVEFEAGLVAVAGARFNGKVYASVAGKGPMEIQTYGSIGACAWLAAALRAAAGLPNGPPDALVPAGWYPVELRGDVVIQELPRAGAEPEPPATARYILASRDRLEFGEGSKSPVVLYGGELKLNWSQGDDESPVDWSLAAEAPNGSHVVAAARGYGHGLTLLGEYLAKRSGWKYTS